MLFLFYLIVILVSTIIKNKKQSWIIYALFLCFMMWTSNGLYTDFDGYYDIFEIVNKAGMNIVGATPGWYLLCRLFGWLGLNYYGMSLTLAFVACYLLHKLFVMFDANENIIWASLMIFPLLINVIQIKFFFGMAIVTFGLKFLLFDAKFSLIKYGLCVIIASSIHSAAAIFIVLLLVRFYEKNGFKKNVIITFLVFIVTIIAVQFAPKVASLFLYESQVNRYILNSSTLSSLKWNFAIAVCWLITLLLIKIIDKITPIGIRNRYRESKANIVHKRMFTTCLLLGLTLPLLTYDRNFHRFIQLGYFLDAIYFGVYWKNAGIAKYSNRNIPLLAFVFYALFMIPAIYSFEFIPVNAVAPLFQILGFPSIFR